MWPLAGREQRTFPFLETRNLFFTAPFDFIFGITMSPSVTAKRRIGADPGRWHAATAYGSRASPDFEAKKIPSAAPTAKPRDLFQR
jgi:hypothetical protein